MAASYEFLRRSFKTNLALDALILESMSSLQTGIHFGSWFPAIIHPAAARQNEYLSAS